LVISTDSLQPKENSDQYSSLHWGFEELPPAQVKVFSHSAAHRSDLKRFHHVPHSLTGYTIPPDVCENLSYLICILKNSPCGSVPYIRKYRDGKIGIKHREFRIIGLNRLFSGSKNQRKTDFKR